jgi:NADH-ubiquinone oxidoreductase chain 4
MFSKILVFTPILGIISSCALNHNKYDSIKIVKLLALTISILNLLISLVMFMLFHFSTNQFQFVEKDYDMGYFDIYLGLDGLSIYFVLLTTFIMPIALLAN